MDVKVPFNGRYYSDKVCTLANGQLMVKTQITHRISTETIILLPYVTDTRVCNFLCLL